MIPILFMSITEKVGVKLINISTLLPTYVTFPRVALAVASLMQEIQRLIREPNSTKYALKVL